MLSAVNHCKRTKYSYTLWEGRNLFALPTPKQ